MILQNANRDTVIGEWSRTAFKPRSTVVSGEGEHARSVGVHQHQSHGASRTVMVADVLPRRIQEPAVR